MERRLWSKAIVAVLRQEATGSVAGVLRSYDRLIHKVREGSRAHVSDWEVGEAMSLRASYLARHGRFKDALAGYLAVAELRRGHLVSNGHSLASKLEAAVSAAIQSGQRKKALVLAQQVVKLRGEYPDASLALEEVVQLLHDEQKRKSNRARLQQLQARRRSSKMRRRPTRR